LRDVSAVELGGLVIREVLNRAKIRPERVDEVIMGNVLQAGLGQNPARQAAIRGGVSQYIPAATVNKVCGSGMKSVIMAAQAIKAGDAEPTSSPDSVQRRRSSQGSNPPFAKMERSPPAIARASTMGRRPF
jgi:hypothetical protein